jgi:hypothetical protein
MLILGYNREVRSPLGVRPICGSSSIWLERFPVTEEAAGSSPVSRANKKGPARVFFVKRERLVEDSTSRGT